MLGEELSRYIDSQVKNVKDVAEHLGISEVICQGLNVFVRFRSLRDEKVYVIRCLYHEDSNHPIASISFVNPDTLANEGNSYWPNDRLGAIKNTNNPPFVCIPGIYEYHYQFHPGAPVLRQHLDLVNVISDILGLLSK